MLQTEVPGPTCWDSRDWGRGDDEAPSPGQVQGYSRRDVCDASGCDVQEHRGLCQYTWCQVDWQGSCFVQNKVSMFFITQFVLVPDSCVVVKHICTHPLMLPCTLHFYLQLHLELWQIVVHIVNLIIPVGLSCVLVVLCKLGCITAINQYT